MKSITLEDISVITGTYFGNPSRWYCIVKYQDHLVIHESGDTEREALLAAHRELQSQQDLLSKSIYKINDEIFKTPSPNAHPQ